MARNIERKVGGYSLKPEGAHDEETESRYEENPKSPLTGSTGPDTAAYSAYKNEGPYGEFFDDEEDQDKAA